jgi:hypothetical protein
VASRSLGVRARAPPRRQAVSVWSLRMRLSSAGSFPVVAAIWLISASCAFGRRRGLATLRAGLVPGLMRPSFSAWV